MVYENHLTFAFPGPWGDGTFVKHSTFAQEPSSGDILEYVKLYGVSSTANTNPVSVYVNTFTSNIDSTIHKPLELDTDYFTYMIIVDQLAGSFRGNVSPVPVPTAINYETTREPYRLDFEVTFEPSEIPFDVFVQLENNDFTGVTPSFDSNDPTRTFSFDQLPDDGPIDTVSVYTVYVHVVNAHGSNTDMSFEITGITGLYDLSFDTFTLVSMGNLDTGRDISLSVEFESDTTLSNVSYYITAYSPIDGPGSFFELINNANVESGELVSGTNNAVIKTDFHGNPFLENGNVVIQGLLVHRDTNKYDVIQYTGINDSITMDIPDISLEDQNNEYLPITLKF